MKSKRKVGEKKETKGRKARWRAGSKGERKEGEKENESKNM